MTSYLLSVQLLPTLQGSEEGSLMWYFLLALTVLLLLLLWWIWWEPWYRQQHPKPEEKQASPSSPQPATLAPTVRAKPTPVATVESEASVPSESAVEAPVPAEAVAPDDLTLIEGIGPKIASILQDAGIHTFAQLAATPISELQAILTGKVRIFFPDTWPEQAELAAKGAWDALKTFQEDLKGGRRQ